MVYNYDTKRIATILKLKMIDSGHLPNSAALKSFNRPGKLRELISEIEKKHNMCSSEPLTDDLVAAYLCSDVNDLAQAWKGMPTLAGRCVSYYFKKCMRGQKNSVLPPHLPSNFDDCTSDFEIDREFVHRFRPELESSMFKDDPEPEEDSDDDWDDDDDDFEDDESDDGASENEESGNEDSDDDSGDESKEESEEESKEESEDEESTEESDDSTDCDNDTPAAGKPDGLPEDEAEPQPEGSEKESDEGEGESDNDAECESEEESEDGESEEESDDGSNGNSDNNDSEDDESDDEDWDDEDDESNDSPSRDESEGESEGEEDEDDKPGEEPETLPEPESPPLPDEETEDRDDEEMTSSTSEEVPPMPPNLPPHFEPQTLEEDMRAVNALTDYKIAHNPGLRLPFKKTVMPPGYVQLSNGFIATPQFTEIFEFLRREDPKIRENTWLKGPAGTGKSTWAEQMSRLLALPYGSISAPQFSTEIGGFTGVDGSFHGTQWTDHYGKPSVISMDDFDNAPAEVFPPFHTALANGYLATPQGMIYRSPENRIMASSNTCGDGADDVYNTTNALNGATKDRLIMFHVDYDPVVDQVICRGHKDLAEFFEDLRNAAEEIGLSGLIVSYRTMRSFCNTAEALGFDKALACSILKGNARNEDNVAALYEALKRKNNKYAVLFSAYVEKQANGELEI